MKISLDWIKDYVRVDIPLRELLDRLTMIGLVVDSVEDRDGDSVLDIETYANRPDTLGHLGIAREIAAMLGVPLAEKTWPLAELTEKVSDCADVQIWDDVLCPRYCGMVVRGLEVGPSPDWLRKRIEAMGLHPINNVVDVTNYVLYATAQPLHAFDFGKVSGSKVIIRKANRGEALKDFEGRIHQLSPEMLVIADEIRPIAIAGVIGGEASGVTAETEDVFIESAHFDPVSVRLTARKLGISTDASYRFERSTDISFPPRAALMAASLLTQMGGKAARGILDVYPKPRKLKSLVLRHRRIGEILGVDVPAAFVEQILAVLGFHASKSQNGAWRVEIPSFRVDIDREADLIEEVARFFGYDKIPSEINPLCSFEPVVDRDRESLEKLRGVLLQHGFDEVINWSFADPEREGLLGPCRASIEIRNPISSRASIMRTNVLIGLLENAAWNRNREMEGVHLFEIGNVYFWEGEKHREKLTLGLLSTGLLPGPGWQHKPARTDFFMLKGALESAMFRLRFEPFSCEPTEHPYFGEGEALKLLYRGQVVGHCGILKPAATAEFALDEPVFAAEMDLEGLFGKQPRPFRYAPVSKYPAVNRDLSFLMDRNIPYRHIVSILDKLAPSLLEGYELRDRFVGPSVQAGKVSLSIRFRYRNPNRTLRAEEVDRVEQDIIHHLKSALNIQLREGKIDN